MNRVKVAHITTIDMSLRYLLLNQLRSLKQTGYQVFGISSPGPEVPAVESTGIRHISVPMSRNVTPVRDLITLWKLYRLFRRERFTIVHTHTPKPGLLGQFAARMVKVPIVVNTLHGFYFHDNMHPKQRKFYMAMEKVAARFSDVILCQSQEDIKTAVNNGICPPGKIKYLGNGIDVERFNLDGLLPRDISRKRLDLGVSPDAPVVGFVGRLVKEKGLLDLFRAARIVRDQISKVRFLIIGPVDTEKRDVLTPEVAHEYGVSDICIFTGMRQDMPELYSSMDVLTLPSHREGFPRAPMEASAMKVPCIVTDIRGCRETVEHGRNGILVPLGDVKALADAIIELLTDREKARRMGEEGRRIALERFDERLVFEKVKFEYSRLLREKGLPVPQPLT